MVTPDPLEATYLIGEVTERLVQGIEGVRVYWRYAQRAFACAQTTLLDEDVVSMEGILRLPESQRYFTNRQELLSSGNYVALAKMNSLQQQESTLVGIAGSALVFAHAVLEDAVYDTLKISLCASPADWIPLVRQQKVPIANAVDNLGSVVQSKIDGLWQDLERAPLMKKVERLFQVVQPDSSRSIVSGYSYSDDRLLALDEKRHEVAHRSRHCYARQDLEDDLTFMFQTGFHLLSLPVEKYNLSASRRPSHGS